jgi:hypothetical protein
MQRSGWIGAFLSSSKGHALHEKDRTMIVRILAAGAIALGSLGTVTGAAIAESGHHTAAHAAKHHRHHHRSHHGIPQHNGGDKDADNNGGPSDGDGRT